MRLRAFGGEGGIRTPAPVARPKALAKPPLRPLGYFSMPAKRIITQRYFKCHLENHNKAPETSQTGFEVVKWPGYLIGLTFKYIEKKS